MVLGFKCHVDKVPVRQLLPTPPCAALASAALQAHPCRGGHTCAQNDDMIVPPVAIYASETARPRSVEASNLWYLLDMIKEWFD